MDIDFACLWIPASAGMTAVKRGIHTTHHVMSVLFCQLSPVMPDPIGHP